METSVYKPNSPYSASKAASDHVMRAWFKTYSIPSIITHCTNNFGPFQHPEKLVPSSIERNLSFQPTKLYGNGKQIRDWLYVEDHVSALLKIAHFGKVGETYNIASNQEITNVKLAELIHRTVKEKLKLKQLKPDSFEPFCFVDDRPGHDFRYSLNSEKLRRELDWEPRIDLETGLRKTVDWYFDNSKFFQKFKLQLSGETT